MITAKYNNVTVSRVALIHHLWTWIPFTASQSGRGPSWFGARRRCFGHGGGSHVVHHHSRRTKDGPAGGAIWASCRQSVPSGPPCPGHRHWNLHWTVGRVQGQTAFHFRAAALQHCVLWIWVNYRELGILPPLSAEPVTSYAITRCYHLHQNSPAIELPSKFDTSKGIVKRSNQLNTHWYGITSTTVFWFLASYSHSRKATKKLGINELKN